MKYVVILMFILAACAPQSEEVSNITVVNTTNITMVQFCSTDVPTYPTTFPEYGIKIGTTIYAVYSTNGGFLTLIPPGEYLSNAVGSRCNFTVNKDGTITN